MIAKIRRNKQQTMATFAMFGIDARSAFTISFIPGFLEIILRGLRALKALKAFKDWRFYVEDDY